MPINGGGGGIGVCGGHCDIMPGRDHLKQGKGLVIVSELSVGSKRLTPWWPGSHKNACVGCLHVFQSSLYPCHGIMLLTLRMGHSFTWPPLETLRDIPSGVL